MLRLRAHVFWMWIFQKMSHGLLGLDVPGFFSICWAAADGCRPHRLANMQVNPNRLWLFSWCAVSSRCCLLDISSCFLNVGSALNFSDVAAWTVLCEHVRVMHQTVDHEHVDGHHKHRANGVERVCKKVLHSRIEIYGFEDRENIFGIWGICV